MKSPSKETEELMGSNSNGGTGGGPSAPSRDVEKNMALFEVRLKLDDMFLE